MKKVLILGYGYAGQGIESELQNGDYDVDLFRTSRSKDDCITFDFDSEETWDNLPKVDGTIWTFPVKDLNRLKQFMKSHGSRLGKIVVVGSTGHFISKKEDEIVDERFERDLSVDRVVCENYLVSQKGILVCSAGIYGPERNPLNWVKIGLVAPSAKYLNAIHYEDLGQYLVKALMVGQLGMVYIASDGRPQRWKALIEDWQVRYNLKVDPDAVPSKKMSKFIMPEWSMEELDVDLKFFDVFEGVRHIVDPEGALAADDDLDD